MDEEELLASSQSLVTPRDIIQMSRSQKSHALLVASRKGKRELVELLLDAGASCSVEDELGCSPMMFVAAQGMHDILDKMLSQPGKCGIHKRTSCQQTALHFAAERGQVKCVEFLVKRGAMVNVADDWGVTPLMKAVISSDPGTVRALLNNGARMDMTDLRSFTALMYAAQKGDARTLSVLLEHGSSVHLPGQKSTPLHQAASFGHLACVDLLLGAGAQPFLRDIHGMLPIELATRTDQLEVVDRLLKYEQLPQEDKNAALMSAAKANALRSFSTLLKGGANPETWISGIPTLFEAVAQNNTEIVCALIQHHCHVKRSLRKSYLFNTHLRDICQLAPAEHICAVTIATLRGYGHLLKILLYAGCSTEPFCRLLAANLVPDEILQDEPLMLWVLDRATQPIALIELCRSAICERLSDCHGSKVKELPLPKSVRDFIHFPEIVHL